MQIFLLDYNNELETCDKKKAYSLVHVLYVSEAPHLVTLRPRMAVSCNHNCLYPNRHFDDISSTCHRSRVYI